MGRSRVTSCETHCREMTWQIIEIKRRKAQDREKLKTMTGKQTSKRKRQQQDRVFEFMSSKSCILLYAAKQL